MAQPGSTSRPSQQPPALTLIDGYNLIHAVGIGGQVQGRGDLERTRAALIQFLAESLPEGEAARTIVVFDAARPPPGLPRSIESLGITVLFAAGHEDADALLEVLIAEHGAPRKLTVVSSDHRLQQAARRRRARAVDSDVWYEELLRERQARAEALTAPAARPEKPADQEPEEVEYWLSRFSKPQGEAAKSPPAKGPGGRTR